MTMPTTTAVAVTLERDPSPYPPTVAFDSIQRGWNPNLKAAAELNCLLHVLDRLGAWVENSKGVPGDRRVCVNSAGANQ